MNSGGLLWPVLFFASLLWLAQSCNESEATPTVKKVTKVAVFYDTVAVVRIKVINGCDYVETANNATIIDYEHAGNCRNHVTNSLSYDTVKKSETVAYPGPK
jgi:hypothetical protein